MGTVWFFANTATITQSTALKSLIGGCIVILIITTLPALLHKKGHANHVLFACICTVVIITTAVLLSGAVDTLTYAIGYTL